MPADWRRGSLAAVWQSAVWNPLVPAPFASSPADVTNRTARVRNRTHGGVAGVGGDRRPYADQGRISRPAFTDPPPWRLQYKDNQPDLYLLVDGYKRIPEEAMSPRHFLEAFQLFAGAVIGALAGIGDPLEALEGGGIGGEGVAGGAG
jgi:hypothetical protein